MPRRPADFPSRKMLRELGLRWLLENPGEQRRRSIVDGAVASHRFAHRVKALRSRQKRPTYDDALHASMDYAIWDLKDEELIVRTRFGYYELSRTGRAQAKRLPGRVSLSRATRIRSASGRSGDHSAPVVDDGKRLGVPYRRITVSGPAVSVVYQYDPDQRDRQTRAHHMLQDKAADAVARLGFEPRSPAPAEPQFDLAYDETDRLTVIEVKSLPKAYVESQLRLGMGQVLQYAYQLSGAGLPVRPVLLVERRPPSPWPDVCALSGVTLAWPSELAGILSGRTPESGVRS